MAPRLRSVAGVAAVVAAAAAVLVLISGPGYRFGVLALPAAFTLLRWGALASLGAAMVAAIVLWRARGRDLLAITAVVVGLIAFAVPFRFQRLAAAAPPIHDITTDTANPPEFHAVVPLRAEARNPLEYSQEVARQQREAYPDIRPLIMEMPPPQVFDRALAAAREAGWEIVEANADTGRIEATDTTTFFGFKDDVVVRLTPLENRTVVDVRSVSRVGRGDAGTNARRIRTYLDRLSRR
jgi:uncharacterized protein (DUF1499 family)